jgi:hypothetical protein
MAWLGAIQPEMLTDDGRHARRHHLSLSAQALVNGDAARVQIYNLSSTGLLIESVLEFQLGEEVEVELPESGTTRARVVWRSDCFYGCQFADPVPAAAESAARQRSPIRERLPIVEAPFVFPDLAASQASVEQAELTPRQKLAWIVGLGLVCWAPIVAGVLLIS